MIRRTHPPGTPARPPGFGDPDAEVISHPASAPIPALTPADQPLWLHVPASLTEDLALGLVRAEAAPPFLALVVLTANGPEQLDMDADEAFDLAEAIIKATRICGVNRALRLIPSGVHGEVPHRAAG